MKHTWNALRTILACAAVFGAVSMSALAAPGEQPGPTDKFKNLEFREIGPATMGGRIDDFAVVESNPNIVYVGTASGGVWKTTNNGTTWEPIFDKESVSTIGDIAIAPSDPSVLWVGTGEPNNRQSSSWGDGAYKSLDGGKTWKKMGLEATRHIGRIVIHPKNPEVVYVAALGHLWGANPERGARTKPVAPVPAGRFPNGSHCPAYCESGYSSPIHGLAHQQALQAAGGLMPLWLRMYLTVPVMLFS